MQLTDAQIRQIEALTAAGFGNRSDVVRIAVDRMYREEMTMKAQQARQLAAESVEFADEEGYPVADTTVVGKDDNGFWVTDNGEEVSGLTKDQAIEIIVENLTAE